MGVDVISEYEFVQAGENKSHLLMNVLDMKALEAEMTFFFDFLDIKLSVANPLLII